MVHLLYTKVHDVAEMLEACGFEQYGNERFSGFNGRQMETKLFGSLLSVSKHMVEDKVTYRAAGPRFY